jgi:hypothetical protein
MSQRLRVRPDDEWQKVRSRWLGPTPYTWPAARYSAWLLMGSTIVADVIVGALAGWMFGPVVGTAVAMWAVAFTTPAAYLLLRMSGDEMNVRQLLALIWYEHHLPRSPAPFDRPQRLEFRREV